MRKQNTCDCLHMQALPMARKLCIRLKLKNYFDLKIILRTGFAKIK